MAKKRKSFPEGFEWIFYIVGWVAGVFNLVFWILLLVFGLLSKDKHRFIDDDLHRIVYYWGIFVVIVSLFLLMIMILLALLGFSMFGSWHMLNWMY